jgi:hypothetical protein
MSSRKRSRVSRSFAAIRISLSKDADRMFIFAFQPEGGLWLFPPIHNFVATS